jgi:hypothetical protein
MNNIVLGGLVKRRDEDRGLDPRHAPHRAHCVPAGKLKPGLCDGKYA